MWKDWAVGKYLLSEGLPESFDGSWRKGSAGNAAHHNGQTTITAHVGLHGHDVTQFTAGQVGLNASAVDRIVPV